MNMQLVVIRGPDQGRTFPLADGQTLIIGRGQTNDTHLGDPHVSRVHCQVEVDGRSDIYGLGQPSTRY